MLKGCYFVKCVMKHGPCYGSDGKTDKGKGLIIDRLRINDKPSIQPDANGEDRSVEGHSADDK